MRVLAFCRRRWKSLLALVVILFVGINFLAARHARAFLTYVPDSESTPQPEQLSTFRKLGLLFTGVSVPRPKNTADPGSLSLPFTTHRIAMGEEWLEVWQLPAPGSSRGTVILFPGYAASKSTLLPEAAAFHAMGFETILVDFRGAGGSSGHDTTLGFREAEDVAAVVKWADRKVILFGRSMGAVAVLRAMAHHDVNPAAAILECPFDRMLNAVRNRFGAMGLPSFPAAELLLYWGGRRLGFDGFEHNPVRDAGSVRCPTLVLAGSNDARATPAQVRAVYDQLPGEKRFHLFEGAGHEPFLAHDPAAWKPIVDEFLSQPIR